MIIDINVQADSSQIEVVVPQAGLSWCFANSVVYAIANNWVLDIGVSRDDVEKRVLENEGYERWESEKSQLGFAAPFSANTFRPRFAARIVLHYRYRIRKAMHRGILGLFDRFDYHFQIEDYENVPCSKREDFAYLIFKGLKSRQLFINGEIFDSRPYKIAELSSRLFKWGAAFFAFTMVFVFRLSIMRIGESLWMIVLFVGFLGMILGLAYGLPVVWVIIMRRFLPSHTLVVLLPSFRPSQRLLSRLYAMLGRTETGEDCNDDK